LPVLTASCVGWFMAKDSFFGVTGQVLQAAGAANTVAVDSETGCGRGGETPVPRCTVTVVAHEPGATPDRPIQTSTISDGRSIFRMFVNRRPGRYPATLTVTCPGGEPISAVFEHQGPQEHRVMACLAAGHELKK
jgi:hypothetical protein